MGQYHYVVNLTKREFIHPHKLGCGLKLWEQIANHPGTGAALIILLACSNGRGGGDLKDDPAGMIGRWAGDQIAVVGDYAENGDLPKQFKAKEIYRQCGDFERATPYRDISEDVAAVIERELGGKFKGDGWREWTPDDGGDSVRGMRPDLVISVPKA